MNENITTRINVVLAADERYFPGLLACIVSILDSSRHGHFQFRIFDGGLSDTSWTTLHSLRKRFGNLSSIQAVAFDESRFRHCRAIYHGSRLTYARLLMPECLDFERVVYIDADMLVLRPLEELWEVDLGNCLVAAVRDDRIKRLKDDCPFMDAPELLDDIPYFNGGLMLVDLAKWRREGIDRKAFALLDEYPNVAFHDQTIMNFLMRDRVLYLAHEWNMPADAIETQWFGSELKHVLHFTAKGKPWNTYKFRNAAAELFYQYWHDVVCPGDNPIARFGLYKQRIMQQVLYGSPRVTMRLLGCKLLLARKLSHRMLILRSMVRWRKITRQRPGTNYRYKLGLQRLIKWKQLWQMRK